MVQTGSMAPTVFPVHRERTGRPITHGYVMRMMLKGTASAMTRQEKHTLDWHTTRKPLWRVTIRPITSGVTSRANRAFRVLSVPTGKPITHG